MTGRRRNPLTVEGCAQESPEVEAVLAQVWAAYQRKKQRSKASSAARRVSVPQAQEGAEPENDTAPPTAEFSELSIEPEPEEPEPQLAPEPLRPEEPLPAPLPPVQRATSQRPPATPRESQLVQPRRSLFQAPSPAAPVAASGSAAQAPKKVVAAGGLRAALMKRGT